MNWRIGQESFVRTINRSKMKKASETKAIVLIDNRKMMMRPDPSMTSTQKQTLTAETSKLKTPEITLIHGTMMTPDPSMTSNEKPTMASKGLKGKTSELKTPEIT